MPRKLQFYQWKGERRRILAKLQVSIDIDKIQLPKYILSISLEHVILSNSHILSHLHNSILTRNSLPSNWKISFYISQTSQLICQRELFMVTVSCNVKWNFLVSHTVYNDSCFLCSCNL